MWELAPKHSNIEADVYGECRDIDGRKAPGDAGMAHMNAQTRSIEYIKIDINGFSNYNHVIGFETVKQSFMRPRIMRGY